MALKFCNKNKIKDQKSTSDKDWLKSDSSEVDNINSNIYTNGKVGINVQNPMYALDIRGTKGASKTIKARVYGMKRGDNDGAFLFRKKDYYNLLNSPNNTPDASNNTRDFKTIIRGKEQIVKINMEESNIVQMNSQGVYVRFREFAFRPELQYDHVLIYEFEDDRKDLVNIEDKLKIKEDKGNIKVSLNGEVSDYTLDIKEQDLSQKQKKYVNVVTFDTIQRINGNDGSVYVAPSNPNPVYQSIKEILDSHKPNGDAYETNPNLYILRAYDNTNLHPLDRYLVLSQEAVDRLPNQQGVELVNEYYRTNLPHFRLDDNSLIENNDIVFIYKEEIKEAEKVLNIANSIKVELNNETFDDIREISEIEMTNNAFQVLARDDDKRLATIDINRVLKSTVTGNNF